MKRFFAWVGLSLQAAGAFFMVVLALWLVTTAGTCAFSMLFSFFGLVPSADRIVVLGAHCFTSSGQFVASDRTTGGPFGQEFLQVLFGAAMLFVSVYLLTVLYKRATYLATGKPVRLPAILSIFERF